MFPDFEILLCLKKIGPLESSLINIEMRMIIGKNTINKKMDINKSIILFKIKLIVKNITFKNAFKNIFFFYNNNLFIFISIDRTIH